MSDQQEQHLPDVIDRASAVEMESTERSILEVQARCKQVRKARSDGSYEETDCDECGNEVGEQRIRVALMNNLCIHCARVAERLSRR